MNNTTTATDISAYSIEDGQSIMIQPTSYYGQAVTQGPGRAVRVAQVSRNVNFTTVVTDEGERFRFVNAAAVTVVA